MAQHDLVILEVNAGGFFNQVSIPYANGKVLVFGAGGATAVTAASLSDAILGISLNGVVVRAGANTYIQGRPGIDYEGGLGTPGADGYILSSSLSGIRSWVMPNIDLIYSASGITPIADSTYTVGIGGTQNGTITTAKGIITAVQEAIP